MFELAVLALLLGPAPGSPEAVWPSEGETVYVAASFKGLEGVQLVPGARMTYDMAPCKPLTVTKAQPEKDRWVVKDPVGSTETLLGDWLSWMHGSEAECQDQYSRTGEPKIRKSGMTFRMVSKKPGGESGHGTKK